MTPAAKSPAKKTATQAAAKKSAASKAAKKSAATKSTTKKSAAKTTGAKKSAGRLSADEKKAVKQASAERKRTAAGQNTEADVLAAIEAMSGSDKAIAKGLHALVKRIAPDLTARTWYGFPAYAKDGKVVFFWQFAGKFKTRYGHLGFNDSAQLDDGTMWPTAFAITTWDAANEKAVEKLIKDAISG